jgi:hypothetical protein
VYLVFADDIFAILLYNEIMTGGKAKFSGNTFLFEDKQVRFNRSGDSLTISDFDGTAMKLTKVY